MSIGSKSAHDQTANKVNKPTKPCLTTSRVLHKLKAV
jgi:hypothetical protein